MITDTERIAALERHCNELESAISRLAIATANLQGVTCQGAFYTSGLWREKVIKAAEVLKP